MNRRFQDYEFNIQELKMVITCLKEGLINADTVASTFNYKIFFSFDWLQKPAEIAKQPEETFSRGVPSSLSFRTFISLVYFSFLGFNSFSHFTIVIPYNQTIFQIYFVINEAW